MRIDGKGHVRVCPLPGLGAACGPVSGHVHSRGGQVAGGAGKHGWQGRQAGLALQTVNALHGTVLLLFAR